MFKPVVNWLTRHWQGKYGLAVSFWINFVLIRLLLIILQEWLSPAEEQDWADYSLIYVGWALLAHGLVFIWQAVGVLRSAEQHFKLTGSQATSWGAQLSLVPAFFLSATYLLQAWQESRPVIIEENFLEVMERERRKNYSLNINSQRNSIELSGIIELGATRRIAKILTEGFPARALILESSGGNIYEARAIARLLQDNKMNTHVSGTCSSACTAAFIGGTRRTMSARARLGFHQYALEGDVIIVNVDPKREQQKDLELFAGQGVSEAFREKMFKQPPDSMWFPEIAELLSSGVIHEVVEAD